jgi:WD40 repeat protein
MSAEINSMVKNPYVGPQSFDRSMRDYFFGRDEEAHRLFYMVQAHQLVLFYAQTGAGKSSLIQAKLIPNLEEIGWFVFPVGRVVGSIVETEEESEVSSREGNINPFVTNLIRYLLPKNLEGRKSESLSRTIYQRNLNEFFSSIIYHLHDYELSPAFFDGENIVRDPENEDEAANKVLIIDQFEELMTTNLTYWHKRTDFFKQINDLLKQDPGMHIVLVAREEYMPGLIPYANDIEGGIRHRFYMQRLDEMGAEQAIREPAKKFNREYTIDAVKNLLDDLRTIRTGRKLTQKSADVSGVPKVPSDNIQKDLGQFVDPMMLQIFCYQLWEGVGNEHGEITDDYRRNTGGVENALRNFYAQKIKEIAISANVAEFVLRKWIEKNLISGDNRVFVYEGIEKPIGIIDTVWTELEDARLIHSIPHEDRKTYELTHDRLVYVIKENNKTWVEKNLTSLQKAALKWHDLGERDDSLLLKRPELREFKTWMKQNPNNLLGEEIEENFIKRSQKALNASNLKYVFGITALLLVVCLIILVGNNWKTKQEKVLSATRTSVRVTQVVGNENLLATQQDIVKLQYTQIYEQKGIVRTQSAILLEKDVLATENALAAQTSAANIETSVAQEAIAKENARGALSRQLASQGKSYLENNVELGLLLSLAGYQVDPSTWEARSALLAGLTTGLEQNVEPYELTIPSQLGHARTIDISPDGKTVAWGGPQGQIVLWDVATKTPRTISDPLRKWVYSLAFSPTDPNLLISGSQNSELMFWNLRDGTFYRVSLPSNYYDNEYHKLGSVRMLSFSGDGRYIAVHGENSFIQIWDSYSHEEIIEFQASALYYWDIDWSPNSKYLAAAGEDKLLYIFDPASGAVIDFKNNPGGNVPIYNVEWSPDGSRLAFGGNTADSQARVYFYDIRSKNVLQDYLEYQGLYIYGLAYDKPDGKYLVAAGSNQPINIWNVQDKELIANFSTYNSYQFGITFGRGKLALVSENSINVYALNVQEPFSEQLDAPEGVPLNVSVDDEMSLWTISNMGDVLILQNRLKNITYQLGTDVLGSVVLADVYFNPEGPVLISYNDVNKLQQWERDQAQPAILELPNDLQKITNLAISPDGNRLAVSYCDEPNPNQPQTQCYVRILNRSARNKFLTEQQVNTYPAEILKLDFGLAGETLIVGAGDGNSYLIDIPTEKQYFIPLQGIAFALNPEGKTLSIGTADGKLILWDIAAAQEIGALPINSSAPMTSLAYAPDAKTLYAAFSNRVYMAFDVDFDHWFTRLCNIVGRDMTEEEWRQFIPDTPYQPICSPVLSATPIPNP